MYCKSTMYMVNDLYVIHDLYNIDACIAKNTRTYSTDFTSNLQQFLYLDNKQSHICALRIVSYAHLSRE